MTFLEFSWWEEGGSALVLFVFIVLDLESLSVIHCVLTHLP